MDRYVYKIAPAELWRQAEAAGVFAGAPIDFKDGYIHLSSAAQLAETARLYFADEPAPVLIAVDAAACGPALTWELSRGGQPFPHLYAPLALALVAWTAPLGRDGTGAFVLPDLETGS